MKKISLPPAPPATSEAIKASMKGNKSLNTKPEIRLEKELQIAGINSFLRNSKVLPGSPDFIFPQKKLAIFLHGCYWHRCPYCKPHFPNVNLEYWEAKFRRNQARDKRVRAEIRAKGWEPLVVWECVFKKNPRRVVARIKKALD